MVKIVQVLQAPPYSYGHLYFRKLVFELVPNLACGNVARLHAAVQQVKDLHGLMGSISNDHIADLIRDEIDHLGGLDALNDPDVELNFEKDGQAVQLSLPALSICISRMAAAKKASGLTRPG